MARESIRKLKVLKLCYIQLCPTRVLLCYGKLLIFIIRCKVQSGVTYTTCKRSSGTQLGTYLNRKLSLILHLEQLTTKLLKQNSNKHKRVELWAKSLKDFGNFGGHGHFRLVTSAAKILAACTRVCRTQRRNRF